MRIKPIMMIGGRSFAATSLPAGISLALTKLAFGVGNRSTSPAASEKSMAESAG